MANPWEGDYSAKSGVVTDNQNSALALSYFVAQDDSLSFYRKVSSEDDYDFLRFSIDDEEFGKWSGEEGWLRFSYPVEKGAHIFKWDYTKDYSLSNGNDCGWVDYIQLPAFADPVGVPSPATGQLSMALYPNPTLQSICIDYTITENSSIEISIFAANGQPLNIFTRQVVNPGQYQFIYNLDGLAAGTYYCVLTSHSGRIIRPFILMDKH
ncbi:MAG: T9SS type A sorting domain-containing protein, partial [Bacteroidales bacterium]|nr:T9SS type A sorting domain-containing protein [Bacteroidales bacterium]